MEAFDYGRAFGQLLMTFAIFVIVAAALSRIPALKRRLWAAYAMSLAVCLLLLFASPAPPDVVGGTLLLFLPLAFWRYKAATKK